MPNTIESHNAQLKAVFFDLDGTLLDTSQDLGAALNAVLSIEGKPPLPDAITRTQVSNGASALIDLGFGNQITEHEHQRLRHLLLAAYEDNIATHTQAFHGIHALIEWLAAHNIHWGIVTNKPLRYTDKLLKAMHFASPPIATICPDHTAERKPSPEGLLLACRLAQCTAEQAVYVGDHLRDIEAGKNAHMTTIAVGYGFTATTECHHQWGADYNVDCATRIRPLLESLTPKPNKT